MDTYRRPLRAAGLALIVFGVADIGVMVYCIATRRGYSSSFNIFAVMAGVLLVRGSLRTARLAACFTAFFLGGFGAAVVLVPFLAPPALLLTLIRIHPLYTAMAVPLYASFMLFLVWLYRTLARPEVLAAMDEQQVDLRRFSRQPRAGFAVGVLIPLVVAVVLAFAAGSATGRRARAEAARRVGPGYSLYVSSLQTSTVGDRSSTAATVVAYNAHEIREVHVSWGD